MKTKIVYEGSEIVREIKFEDVIDKTNSYPKAVRITFLHGHLFQIVWLWDSLGTEPIPNADKSAKFYIMPEFWMFADCVIEEIRELENQVDYGNQTLRERRTTAVRQRSDFINRLNDYGSDAGNR